MPSTDAYAALRNPVVRRFAETVHARWGRVDVLVNNAGISWIAAAETVSGDDFRRVLDENRSIERKVMQALAERLAEYAADSAV